MSQVDGAPATVIAPVVRRRGAALDAVPLRVRLTVLLVLLVAAGLLAAGAAAASALNGYLVGRVDSQLLEQADRGQLGEQPGQPGRGARRDRALPPGRFYVAALAADGSVIGVVSDPRGGGDDTGATDGAGAPDLSSLSGVSPQGPLTVSSTSGAGQWRVVVRPVSRPAVPALAGAVWATDLGDVRSTTRRLVALELGVGLVVLVLVGGVGYLVVRRSLTPLVEVEEAAAAVASGDLTRRVPERDPRTEVGSLSASFNEMVEQVQQAFATRAASEERLRRFAADASHELRTPLTSIRGFAELYRQGAVTQPDEVARAMGRIEAESVRMGVLVEDLLHLARLDQQRPLERAPVDLLVLAVDAVHDARARAAGGRRIALEADPGVAAVVTGDEAGLRQVLANLVANALTHTPDGTAVTVRVQTMEGPGRGVAVVEVADDGPGLAPDDAARAFERFYRADAARTRGAGGGSGLGLSIVAAIVGAHGGSVDVVTEPGDGALFRVRLPLA